MASVFLITSMYFIYRAGTVSINDAVIEIAFFAAIGFCLYLSYRLIVIINRTLPE